MSAYIAELGAMRRAIALSALGLSTTSPNPPVGCVILDPTGRPVGEGYHRRKGEPHAEVHALTAAGALASGGTAVVTLEPCNHHGRTPPCHQALIDRGIARVVIAVIDPTSRGIGGAARLREAGIEVEVGLLADEARIVLGPWLSALDSKRPRVIWACEITNDNSGPVPDGVFAEMGLRYQVDAIVRTGGHVEEGVQGTHSQGAFALPSAVPTADPATALSSLYNTGARTVLLHGGRELATSFLHLQLIDEVRMFLASAPEPQTGSSYEDSLPSPLTGFSIRSLRKLTGGVLIDASAMSSSDTIAR
jgi:diaminohydroxyphosphoribosylaminopyrimidine deaminase/5-amino-6-(5-phosphoribosylamino)uracil reductase